MGDRKTQFDTEEVYKWIDNYPLTRQKRNISRDFSDAVPLAEILKHHFPRLVHLHNYTPRNSVSQKLINWQTLNRKVLNKLDINLSNTVMDQLSQSAPGVIERILFNIKERLDAKETPEKQMGDVYYVEGLSASISGCIIPLKQKDSSKTVDHKMIPLNEYEEMQNDLDEKKEAIRTLKSKVEHLENLLALKDSRIDDLTRQLQQKGGASSFFNKLF